MSDNIKEPSDAPIHYTAAEADAWANGWNAAAVWYQGVNEANRVYSEENRELRQKVRELEGGNLKLAETVTEKHEDLQSARTEIATAYKWINDTKARVWDEGRSQGLAEGRFLSDFKTNPYKEKS